MASSSASKKRRKGQKRTARQEQQLEQRRSARAKEKAQKREKEAKKKRTGKEIAIIVVSVIMVVSILLPSFSQIFTSSNKQSTTVNADGTVEKNPTNWDETQEVYQKKVDTAQDKLNKNKDDQKAMLELADDYYNWASKANSYASNDDDKKNQVKEYYQKAIDEYNVYLDAVGNIDSTDAETAAINRAMAYKSIDNKDEAINELKDITSKKNSANAWLQLGIIYDADESKSADSMIAYEHAMEYANASSAGARSYAVQRLTAKRSSKQKDSGGPAAIYNKCDFAEGATKGADLSGTLMEKVKFVAPTDDSSSNS